MKYIYIFIKAREVIQYERHSEDRKMKEKEGDINGSKIN